MTTSDRIDYGIRLDDPKWLRAMKFLMDLGAPMPRVFKQGSISFAKFSEQDANPALRGIIDNWVTVYVGIAAVAPGVTATDLFRHGIIKLSEGAMTFGGVPNLPIEDLERILPTLAYRPPKVTE